MLNCFWLLIFLCLFFSLLWCSHACYSQKIMVIEIWSSRYDDSWGEGSVTVIGIVVALRPSLLLRQDNGVISCTISDMKDLFFALMTTTHFTWFIIIFKWLNMKENSFNEFIWYSLSYTSWLFSTTHCLRSPTP